MTRWSSEIAIGMEFIASKHIVHLDLATRNILLTSDRRAKITDFGLSRRMYDYQSYIKKHQEPLPWGSMAPESLKRSEFTQKSDVWAFGILLWEIYSLGDEPYPGVSWDVNFPTKLERGLRPGEPTYNQSEMYLIMCHCWNTDPERRPTFAGLVTTFETLFGACDPSSLEICDEAQVPDDGCESEYANGITSFAVEDEYVRNSQTIPEKRKKMCLTSGSMWSCHVVIVLLIILLSIWSIWGVGLNVEGHGKTTGTTLRPQVVQNTSWTTSSPMRPPNTQAINRTALGHKLFIAIVGKGRKEEAVEALVQLGADIGIRDELGRTPLISAADCSDNKSNCMRIIKFLIENGANVYATDVLGNTFLQKLANGSTGYFHPVHFHEITLYLISKNMTELFADRTGDVMPTPLELAILYSEVQKQTLWLLRKHDATFNDTIVKPAVLENAIKGKRTPQFISTLIELGANWRYVNPITNSNLLHLAASNCYSDGVQYFSNKGLEINSLNKFGETPLHLAVEPKYGKKNEAVLEIVEFLIGKGASVSLPGRDGRTPFSIAMEWGASPRKCDLIQMLTAAESFTSDLSKLTREQLGHRLFDAINQQSEETVTAILKIGADIKIVNVENCEGRTPLLRAAKCVESETDFRYRIIKQLINNGADVYASLPDVYSVAPAGEAMDTTFLQIFIECTYLTPSHFHDIASFLVSKNLSMLFNLKGFDGDSIFQKALKIIEVELNTLTLLHENGIDFSHKDNYGQSTLFYALEGPEYKSVKFLSKLMELGVDWKSSNKYNQSLLHSAVGPFAYVETVKFLVNKGLDVNAQDYKGNTPLHDAIIYGFYPTTLEVVQVLIENGADTNIKDNKGDSPLSIALWRKYDKRLIKLLQGGG